MTLCIGDCIAMKLSLNVRDFVFFLINIMCFTIIFYNKYLHRTRHSKVQDTKIIGYAQCVYIRTRPGSTKPPGPEPRKEPGPGPGS